MFKIDRKNKIGNIKIKMTLRSTGKNLFSGTLEDMEKNLAKTDKLKDIRDKDEYFRKLMKIQKKYQINKNERGYPF